MTKNFAGITITLLVLLLGFSSCNKYKKNGHIQEPGVVLTFDDDRVDNWYKSLPLLDSAGVRATFYICKYNRFTPVQKYKLSIIQSHGHEIAYHTTNHYNMMDYVYKGKHTVEELMKNEVEDGLTLMNRDGFYPTTFAYPYGAHSAVYDKMLMRYFKSVRGLNGTTDYSKSLAPMEKNEVIYGLVIDKNGGRSDESILRLMNSASENKAYAVFTGHDINSSISLSVTRDRLMKIFNHVKDLGLKYYTVSEISQ